MKLDFNVLLAVYFVSCLVLGVVGLWGLPEDFEVEPEYISGMLTASAIVFGFWAILIQTKPKERIEKWRYEHVFSKVFFVSFGLLIFSLVAIYFAALNKLWSATALYVCLVSFLSNALFITMVLYYSRFEKS
ncbi:MAG: hypothetical protein E3J73_05240 [Candidatus Bathyarchaeum sp.]|nr:MAG: hypothetical protein E3J73_05240 [Candidatus Bathyarchaeum sp.]